MNSSDCARTPRQRGEDAAATAAETYPLWFDPKAPIGAVLGGNLPHWRQAGVIYFVTWRTHDSMPAKRVAQWQSEREAWLIAHPPPHDNRTKAEYDRLFYVRWERWLDESHGECLLREPRAREIIEGALRYFHGKRYLLEERTVAPNHVHALVMPLPEFELSDIVQTWKSYTAHEINKAFGRKGTFWQKESFDHIVRSPAELERIKQYIRDHIVDAASSPRSSDAV